MADIYQEIWDADQSANGVQPITDATNGHADRGYVVVASGGTSKDFRLLSEVVIPDSKKHTYELVTALFDNYSLSESDPEVETQQERDEVHDLLQAVIDTAPMQVARRYVEAATGSTLSSERWYATLLELWFRRFSQGGDPDLSGFEHVFVGEQEGAKIQGYHFWYKYFLDDGFASKVDSNLFPGLKDDRIQYLRSEATDSQQAFPESVTLSYKWDAPDYEAKKVRPLTKPKGGFFVGCSVEGLMAMGAVRAHLGARAPKEAIINGGRYDLKLFRSADDKNIRTFYPVFLGPAPNQPFTQPTTQPTTTHPTIPTPVVPQPTPGANAIRILAALVNPYGDDPGRETVTLINVGKKAYSIARWKLVDKSHNSYTIADLTLKPGIAVTLTLPEANGLQLSNKGGEIRLVDDRGNTRHAVSYSKAQAKREGETIIF